MTAPRRALVHRLPANSPDDTSALVAAVQRGEIDPTRIVAILGKTEGNGCVNDFTRGYATLALKQAVAALSSRSLDDVAENVAFVMSGGTEGGLSPHWLVFETRLETRFEPGDAPPAASSVPDRATLAIGVAMTPDFAPPRAMPVRWSAACWRASSAIRSSSSRAVPNTRGRTAAGRWPSSPGWTTELGRQQAKSPSVWFD